jgi:ABC-type bacteriocin/lantibiotic exporter with double-glycine peptidase domain
LMWLACLFISVAFIALTYVVVDHNDWWLAWCTMAIGTVIMLATFGSMCYCIIAHRLEQKNTRKIRKASANQSGSWSRSVGSDQDLLNSEYKKMYAL